MQATRDERQRRVDLQQRHIAQLILLANEFQNVRLKLKTDSRVVGRITGNNQALSFDNADIEQCMSRIDRGFVHLEMMIDRLNQKIRLMDADNYGG